MYPGSGIYFLEAHVCRDPDVMVMRLCREIDPCKALYQTPGRF